MADSNTVAKLNQNQLAAEEAAFKQSVAVELNQKKQQMMKKFEISKGEALRLLEMMNNLTISEEEAYRMLQKQKEAEAEKRNEAKLKLGQGQGQGLGLGQGQGQGLGLGETGTNVKAKLEENAAEVQGLGLGDTEQYAELPRIDVSEEAINWLKEFPRCSVDKMTTNNFEAQLTILKKHIYDDAIQTFGRDNNISEFDNNFDDKENKFVVLGVKFPTFKYKKFNDAKMAEVHEYLTGYRAWVNSYGLQYIADLKNSTVQKNK